MFKNLYFNFLGNRVLSYGGTLSLTQEFTSTGYPDVSEPGKDVVLVGDGQSIYWSNPTPIRSGEALVSLIKVTESHCQSIRIGIVLQFLRQCKSPVFFK